MSQALNLRSSTLLAAIAVMMAASLSQQVQGRPLASADDIPTENTLKAQLEHQKLIRKLKQIELERTIRSSTAVSKSKQQPVDVRPPKQVGVKAFSEPEEESSRRSLLDGPVDHLSQDELELLEKIIKASNQIIKSSKGIASGNQEAENISSPITSTGYVEAAVPEPAAQRQQNPYLNPGRWIGGFIG